MVLPQPTVHVAGIEAGMALNKAFVTSVQDGLNGKATNYYVVL